MIKVCIASLLFAAWCIHLFVAPLDDVTTPPTTPSFGGTP